MSDDAITPIIETARAPSRTVLGRPADMWAAMLATLGAVLAVITALWFFLGFVENDKRPEHLLSAFILTAGLFVFAVTPFALCAGLARRVFMTGGGRPQYILTLFLMLPWVALSLCAMIYTPLPVWVGGVSLALSALLSLWALISLLLDWGNTSPTPPVENPDTSSKTRPEDDQ